MRRAKIPHVIAGGLLLTGFVARLVALDRIPLPVQQDELSNIYDGYAIAQTGADRAGISYPLVVRGFGEIDYRPALYAWLAAIPAKFIGFSMFGGRLPAALLGCASLVLVVAFATRIGGTAFGLAALALAAFSPWLVSFSRVAHEGAILPPFFLILIFFLWERTYAREFALRWTAALGLAVGFSSSAYQSTRLTAPLIAACICIFILRHSRRRWRDLAMFSLAGFAGALPQLYVLVTDSRHFFARSRDTLAAAGSTVDFLGGVARNAAANFGAEYLFMPNMAETFLTSARLLPIEILLFYPGLLAITRLRCEAAARFRPWLYAALVIAVLPAALSNQNPHSLRASGIAILTPLFSAATVVVARDWLRKRVSLAAFDSLAGASIVVSAAAVAFLYVRSPTARAERMQSELTLAARSLAQRDDGFQRVFFEKTGTQPYLYVVAMTGMTPQEYRASAREAGTTHDGWEDVRRIGKYYFLDRAGLEGQVRQSVAENSRDLFIAHDPLPGTTAVDSVASVWKRLYIMGLKGRCDSLPCVP